MNNSKWAKIFDVIVSQTGVDTATAKLLGSDRLYAMRLAIYSDTYSDTLRGYTKDWIAGPLKLNEIEYMTIALPPETDIHQLEQALQSSGQYAFALTHARLTVYGYT